MIALTKLRELTLSGAPAAGRHLHLSAASGLVCVKSFIYVVADDELHLGVFGASGDKPGHLIRLFDGALPDAKSNRKKRKPDLEALVLLPAYEGCPEGALLAIGSGSTRRRRMGALLRLNAQGAVCGPAQVVDLSLVFAPLDDLFPALNIEGAVVSGDELRLFQRGNKRQTQNAIIRFGLSAVRDALTSGRTDPIEPRGVDSVDLGQIDGIPFCFTDAAILPDGDMVFAAVAEDTDNPYDDGRCAAAAVGMLDQSGRMLCLHRLEHPHKIEGVDARADGDIVKLLLVTDADDADVPASLFSATMGR